MTDFDYPQLALDSGTGAVEAVHAQQNMSTTINSLTGEDMTRLFLIYRAHLAEYPKTAFLSVGHYLHIYDISTTLDVAQEQWDVLCDALRVTAQSIHADRSETYALSRVTVERAVNLLDAQVMRR